MSGKAAFIGEQQAKLLAVPPPTLQPDCSQRLIEIADNILWLFQPNAKTDKAFLEFFWIEMNPFIIARLGENQALIMSERHGKGHNL